MNRKIGIFISCITLALLIAACSNNKEQTSTTTQPATPAATAPAAEATGAPGSIITGKVLETLDTSGYTYMHLDEGNKQTWVAVPEAKVAVGDKVSVIFSMEMKNFESKTLGRTFDEVIFASGFAPGSQPAATAGDATNSSFSDAVKSSGSDAPPMASGGSGAAVVPFSDLKVEKAKGENAYTVGELFEKKSELNGKPVTLRGKVVKISKNIMGKNWIHIQDGTGNPKENSHDFVVTAASVPEMDQVITVSGVLEADKDFGYGYVYSAIIEDASIE